MSKYDLPNDEIVDKVRSGEMSRREFNRVLAAAGVSVFPFASYDTDWLLVKEESLERARAALVARGHRIES